MQLKKFELESICTAATIGLAWGTSDAGPSRAYANPNMHQDT
jgi:hypothetical protein